ncbi:hypothetical protein EVAR_70037_1 [Eumeta japonica]|uniref:Uncharacterized protein n=1 Tax=Eumeta variegata TaxID=151549 RepID=A0A4C2ABV5_EUMVA|nr:hypothetical protein EVAR_70037_1 [Eumeta japonica]
MDKPIYYTAFHYLRDKKLLGKEHPGQAFKPNIADPTYSALFATDNWLDFEYYELTKVMRQDNIDFINALNNLSMGTMTEKDTQLIRGRQQRARRISRLPTPLSRNNTQVAICSACTAPCRLRALTPHVHPPPPSRTPDTLTKSFIQFNECKPARGCAHSFVSGLPRDVIVSSAVTTMTAITLAALDPHRTDVESSRFKSTPPAQQVGSQPTAPNRTVM